MFLLGQAGVRKESEGVNPELGVGKFRVLASVLVQCPHDLERLMLIL